MTDGRVNVLASISRQIRLGSLPPAARLEHPGAMPVAAAPADLVATFSAELEALAVTVHHVDDDSDAAATVVSIAGAAGARQVLAWDDEWLNCPPLPDALSAAGIVRESCWLPMDPEARTQRLAELDGVKVGVTGALAGLADTGSLAMVSGPGRARIASLLTPIHIAVIRATQIVPSYAAFLAMHPDVAEHGSNLVLITGPSRTADIEMTLTRGVHGPGQVHVVVVGKR